MYYPYYVQDGQQASDAILMGIKREATAIDFYDRLARLAPNGQHRSRILQSLETRKVNFNQFTSLYFSLTGRQPVYQVDTVNFQTYREGLRKAYEAGIEGSEVYRRNALFTTNPLIQHVFLHASAGERENAVRFGALGQEATKDYGPKPLVIDIEKVTKQNRAFRTALWTGKHLQLTLMCINVGEDIGLEVHPNLDQFIRIEEGEGLVQMGDSQSHLDFKEKAYADYAIIIPAGKWHNLTNTGNKPLKLYSIYTPPQHPFGTVHKTKAEAMATEEHH